MNVRCQRGFTIVELLVALGISGLILPVLVVSLYQIITGTVEIKRDFVVQQAIDGASVFLTRDLSLAQKTDVVDLAPSVPTMRVEWVDETGWATEGEEGHSAEYRLGPPGGPTLYRYYDCPAGITSTADADCPNGIISVAARNLSAIQFSREGDFIQVAMTSFFEDETTSLSYFVTPRSDEPLETI